MLKEVAYPPKIMPSVYGPPPPRQRAADLPGLVSLEVGDLFPDITPAIYLQDDSLSIIRSAAEEALAGVNMNMIKATDTVNVLCSEHGFAILGGWAYAEMIKAIKDVVRTRTGCENIRLRVAVGFGYKEAPEIIDYYGLEDYFEGQTAGVTPMDHGVPIETEIGTLYGLAEIYDADWFIQAHHGDLRELYWHRLIDQALKPFTMSYARLETRGVYHFNFGPRSSNFVQRAIFDSPFIQERYAFSSLLLTAPSGIIGIDADNDLNQINLRLTVQGLKSYGKMVRLFAEIDACVPVLDAGKWLHYQHASGITFGNLVNAQLDFFDLDTIPAGTGFALFERVPGTPKIKAINPALKALVINHMYTNMMCTELPLNIPTVVVGRDLADRLSYDPANPEFMSLAVSAKNLAVALNFARRIAGTDNVIVFDGSYGRINLSPALGEFLMEKAPDVSRKVEEELLPKWLKQRGLDPMEVSV
jgi:hypothetical protein